MLLPSAQCLRLLWPMPPTPTPAMFNFFSGVTAGAADGTGAVAQPPKASAAVAKDACMH